MMNFQSCRVLAALVLAGTLGLGGCVTTAPIGEQIQAAVAAPANAISSAVRGPSRAPAYMAWTQAEHQWLDQIQQHAAVNRMPVHYESRRITLRSAASGAKGQIKIISAFEVTLPTAAVAARHPAVDAVVDGMVGHVVDRSSWEPSHIVVRGPSPEAIGELKAKVASALATRKASIPVDMSLGPHAIGWQSTAGDRTL